MVLSCPGIAVVIDDKIMKGEVPLDVDDEPEDLIVQIVERIAGQWNLAFYSTDKMPDATMWPSLLRSASFVMLDWRLWPRGAGELEREGIRDQC